MGEVTDEPWVLFPAYAGVILDVVDLYMQACAFPRICGGDPRVRWHRNRKTMLFPAYAGVIPIMTFKEVNAISFPRICGGDPT